MAPICQAPRTAPKNHCLSDNGIQTIPRKQIHDEIPSEVDFFGPNSNFPQVQEFLLVTPPGIPCMGHGTRFCVDSDRLRSLVALRVRNRSRRGCRTPQRMQWIPVNLPSRSSPRVKGEGNPQSLVLWEPVLVIIFSETILAGRPLPRPLPCIPFWFCHGLPLSPGPPASL